MDHAKQLIAVIDEPGAERDALAEAITCDGMWVFAADNIDHLPSGTALIVAHARAVPRPRLASPRPRPSPLQGSPDSRRQSPSY